MSNTSVPLEWLIGSNLGLLALVVLFGFIIRWHKASIRGLKRDKLILIDEGRRLRKARDHARDALGKAHKRIDLLQETFEAMSDLSLAVRHCVQDVDPNRGGNYLCGTLTGQFRDTHFGRTAEDAVREAILANLEKTKVSIPQDS